MSKHNHKKQSHLLIFSAIVALFAASCSTNESPTEIDINRQSQNSDLSSDNLYSSLTNNDLSQQTLSSESVVSSATNLSSSTARELIQVDCGHGGSCAPGDTTVPIGSQLIFFFVSDDNYAIDSILLNKVLYYYSDSATKATHSFSFNYTNIQMESDFVVRFKKIVDDDSTNTEQSSTVSSSAENSSSSKGKESSSSKTSSSSKEEEKSSSNEGILLTIDCGKGGSCSPSKDTTVAEGTSLTARFTANTGHKIDSVLYDGNARFYADSTDRIYGSFELKINNISQPHFFRVRFAEIKEVSSSSSLSSEGESSKEELSSKEEESSSSSETEELSSAIVPGTVVRFDYTSSDNTGDGLMTADASGEKSARVEAQHKNGTWYPMAGWVLEGDDCPVDNCYWGWNDRDAITNDGYSVRVSLLKFVNPTGWGYSNGGPLFILDGYQLDNAKYVDIGSSFTVKLKGANGKKISIFVLDHANPDKEISKYRFDGTGDWQTITVDEESFSPKVSFGNAKAISLQYELGAPALGVEEIAKATGYPIDRAPLVWQSLKTAR